MGSAESLAELRQQVVKAGRRMYALGLVRRLTGNVSACDARRRMIAIKPSGVAWDALQADRIVILDLEGRVVEGEGPSLETPMHLSVYAHVPAARAVVHSHSPLATGFAVARRPIPPLHTGSAEVGGEVPLVPYAPPGSQALAQAVAALAPRHPALLLANHGVLCWGEDLTQALERNLLLEDLARWALIQGMLGSQARLSAAELRTIRGM